MAECTEREFLYRSPGLASGLLLGLYRLKEEGKYVDVKLTVGKHTFPAHRCVLAAASDYFSAMFGGELLEADQSEVTLHQMAPHVFSLILDFLYTGEVLVTESNCLDLFAAADMLRVVEVMRACSSFLQSQLCPANAFGIYLFADRADRTNCGSLQQAAEQYITNHFLDAVKCDEFMRLDKDVLLHFLHSEDLQIDKEYQVFEAAMSWILHDAPSRRSLMFEVLKPVRFPIMTEQSLSSYIAACPDLSLRIALHKLTQDYHGYRRLSHQLKLRRVQPCLLQPRRKSPKSIYVMGGYSREAGGRWGDSKTLVTVECFDTFSQAWRAVPPLLEPRSGHGAAVHHGGIYVVGGESDALIFDSCEFYEAGTGAWTLLPTLTTPRCGLGLVVLDGSLYTLGGWIGSEIGSSIEKYDSVAGSWDKVDALQRPVFAMGVVTHQGLIYVIGGTNEMGAEVRDTLSYNPVTREWTTLAPLLTERAYAGVTVLDGHVYVIGGWNETNAALNSVEAYSIQEDRWRPLPSLGVARAGASVTSVNGMIYVIGGRSSSHAFTAPSTLATVECFDPQTETWFEVEPMPTHRCEAAIAVL